MALPTAWMDELLSKNDIVSVLSGYMELKPKGRKLWGLCPLHGEKTASFSVSPDKQMFYCFGCHAGGTVIQFIMAMERLPFIEAVQLLASRVGMELPSDVNDKEMQRQRAYRERLYQANARAAKFFFEQFLGSDGEAARSYANRRGLQKDTVVRFGIGYAPNGWDNLLKCMTSEGYSQKELLDAGLLVHNTDKDSVYDAYRNRLIFPIIGTNGKVLGFGGRVLDDSKPKYINTGDTPVYNKRNNLYGLYQLKNEKLGDIIMVEGYMDVIGLYKAGVSNAVASLGTALTQQQARLLKRYVQTVYIAYDGDAAGQNATIRGMEILANEGLSVRVITFPDELDPDEYVQVYGKDGFDRLKENASSLGEFKIDSLAAGVNFANENEREGYAVKCCEYIATLQPLEQERYYAYLAKKTGYTTDALKRQGSIGGSATSISTLQRRGVFRRTSADDDTERDIIEGTMLAAALSDGEARRKLIMLEGDKLIKNETYLALFNAMNSAGFSLAAYTAGLDSEQAERISKLTKLDGAQTNPVQTVLDAANRINKLNRERELAQLQSRMNDSSISPTEKAELMAQFTKLIRTIK